MMDNKNVKSNFEQAKFTMSSFLVEKLKSANGKKFVFLLVGRTGVGKSSTINSLMGEKVAKVGDYEPTTSKVESYECQINGIDFRVIDTPGLCDDVEKEGNDQKYLELIRSKVKQLDSMWFVSRLDETRVTADEKRGIQLISDAFSPNVWKHAVIIFTYANSVGEGRYHEALNKRTELIKKEIAKYTKSEVVNSIPSLAVDNTSATTPDGKEWLGELYTKVCIRISDQGLFPFLMATADSIKLPPKADKKTANNTKDLNPSFYSYSFTAEQVKERQKPRININNVQKELIIDSSGTAEQVKERQKPRININDAQKELIKHKVIDAGIIPGLAVAGAGIGSVLGPVGAVIGGAVGAALGLLSWLFP